MHVTVPDMPQATRTDHVREALVWVREEFPDNPGETTSFHWPTTHRQAENWLRRFLEDRFADFGPYEDAIAVGEPWLFHSTLSPLMSIGLDPERPAPGATSGPAGGTAAPAWTRSTRW